MSDARDELFEVLTGGGWMLAPGEADDMNRLIDNFAHELAEKIRAVGVDGWEGTSDMARAVRQARATVADLIDPEVEQ